MLKGWLKILFCQMLSIEKTLKEFANNWINFNLIVKLYNYCFLQKEPKNCPCGELIEDCSYPKCGLGGEILEEDE